MLSLATQLTIAIAIEPVTPVGALSKPCLDKDPRCPSPTCPPLGDGCELEPNPLVIDSHGHCCPESPCPRVHCPTECQGDAGTRFTDSFDGHFYDCGRTSDASECYKTVADGAQGAPCKCVVKNCIASSQHLLHQPSTCVIHCEEPKHTGSSICPDCASRGLEGPFASLSP